jgi:cytochrome c-type biogenesis protein
MDVETITLPLAFLAGLLSFVSPCVLPLVPAYIGYLGGTTVLAGEQPGFGRETWRTFSHSVLFVLGFMVVFILLGASASFVGRLLLNYAVVLQRVGGVLLIIFGMRLMAATWNRDRWIAAAVLAGLLTLFLSNNLPLQRVEESLLVVAVILAGAGFVQPVQIGLAIVAGVLNFLSSYDTFVPNLLASLLIAAMAILLNRSDLFYAEKKLELRQSEQTGHLRSLLFGVVFAAGWTPCVGPILAAILVVASTLQTVGQGISLLTAYSLGLGIPFLLVGLALGPLSTWLRKMNRYLGIVSVVSGGLLVLMGVLIFTDSLGFLAQYGNFFELGL